MSGKLDLEVMDSKMIGLIMNGEKVTKAMEMVGYSPATINQQSGRVSARIRERLCEELHKQGLSPQYLIGKLLNGIEEASRPVIVDKTIQDYPDHNTRLSYIREVLKIMDAYPSERLEISAETYEERIMRLHSQSQA